MMNLGLVGTGIVTVFGGVFGEVRYLFVYIVFIVVRLNFYFEVRSLFVFVIVE